MTLAVCFAALTQTATAARPNATELDVARLSRGLAGSPMAGTARLLVANGRRVHVSPFFMAAVAKTESDLGRSACYENPRNVWGLASCNQSWTVPDFPTWRAAIRFYADFLASRWPRHSTPYSFRGYATGVGWADHVVYWMRALFGVGPSTRYP